MPSEQCAHQWTLALADQGFTYCEICRTATELRDLPSLDLIRSVADAVRQAFQKICQAHSMLGKDYVLFAPYRMSATAFNGIPDIKLSQIGNAILDEIAILQEAVSKEDAIYPIVMNIMPLNGCVEKVIPGYDLTKHTEKLSQLLSDFAVAALARDSYNKESALSFVALSDIDLKIHALTRE